jgi:hypothetical protein
LGVDEGVEEGEEDWEKAGSGVHGGPVLMCRYLFTK